MHMTCTYTDNGSNFIGGNKELKTLFDLLRSDSTQEQLHHWASVKGIIWHFSPGRAPHFGGLWEAAVRCMKQTLKKVVGEQVLRNDELVTLLHEASAVLNSQPFGPH